MCSQNFFVRALGIVIGAIPVDRSVLADNFVAAMSGNGNSRHLAESPQTVRIVARRASCATSNVSRRFTLRQLFSEFAVERCGAQWMTDSVVPPNECTQYSSRPKRAIGKIASKDRDACFECITNLRKIKMQLQRVPKTRVRLVFRFCAHQQNSADRL